MKNGVAFCFVFEEPMQHNYVTKPQPTRHKRILRVCVGHLTLKWVGVFGAKRRTLGLKNGFWQKKGLKSGLKELKFRRKWALGAAKLEKFANFGVKIQEFRKLGSSEWDQTANGV